MSRIIIISLAMIIVGCSVTPPKHYKYEGVIKEIKEIKEIEGFWVILKFEDGTVWQVHNRYSPTPIGKPVTIIYTKWPGGGPEIHDIIIDKHRKNYE